MNEPKIYTITDCIDACKRKGELKAIAQLPHIGDQHLFLVVIQATPLTYVVWMFNAQTGGFADGNYVEDIHTAYTRFMERLRQRVMAGKTTW